MTKFAHIAAIAAATAGFAAPAAAAENFPWTQDTVRERSAFAGASVRLPLGARRNAAPEARLGVGFHHSRHDPAGSIGATPPTMALAVGFDGGRLELLAGGERLAQVERRLGLADSSKLLLVGGLVAGVAAVVLLADGGDDDDEEGPCPPGVEVCTQ